MLPLGNPLKSSTRPYMTYLLITLNFLVFAWETGFGQLEYPIITYGVIPYEITTNFFSLETPLDIVRSLFIHGSVVHLLLNMLYLWLFGEMMEDWLKPPLFLGLYLLCGVAGFLIQVLVTPNSIIPLIGTSSAITGIMGGYLVMYPQTRIRTITVYSVFSGKMYDIPATGIVLLWFLLQIILSFFSINMGAGHGNLAFFSHFGSLLIGGVLITRSVRRTFGSNYKFAVPTFRRNLPGFPRKIIPMNEYRGSNRNAPGVAYNWESTDATSGAALQRAESKLQTLKEQASTKLTAPSVETPAEKPALDLTYLALPARKREAIRYLSTRRGSIVTIQTDSKMVHTGKVTRLTGTQVVLEDEEKNARWLLFTEIIKIF